MKDQQKGFSLIIFSLVVAIIVFLGLCVVRVSPLYFNDIKIEEVMKSLQENSELPAMSRRDIRNLVARRFDMNSIEHVTAEQIKIKKLDRDLLLVVDYEARVHMFHNLYVSTIFHHEAEVSR